MHRHGRTAQGLGLALVAILTASSCVDEEIVFRDRVLFDEVPAEAMGFLGYSNSETKLTVCGNCHVGQQSRWIQTAHADAWDGLQQSPGAQEFCESCHTVNELGNELTDVAGHNAFADERYYDVQCESCHGPGELHVENPDASANHPQASIAVGDLDALTNGCGECHSDAHHPFAENWADSPHSTVGFAASRDGCNSCHEGKGALAAFGSTASYLEQGSDELLPITCVVCHDPHNATNEAQLRFPVASANLEENLCARCHNRRSVPDPGSSHGLEPHAPSAALLLGDAGWFPPGAEIDQGQIIASHGSERNERLCATCHVASFEVTDPDTEGFLETATGHLFNAIPCVDQDGIPVEGDCGLSADERSLEGCTGSGCHLSVQGAFAAVFTKAGDIQALAEELHELLVQVDPNLTDPGGEIDAGNPVFTVAEGAFFNFALAEFGGPDREGRLPFVSAATHNPFLVPELLRASIELVEDEYGVTASPEAAAPAHLTSGAYKTLILPDKTQ